MPQQARQAGRSWWRTKVRQFRSHLGAKVAPSERDDLAGWLTTAQLRLYDGMHVADQRHGLDVVTTLRREGVSEPDVLIAGLLHDTGKGLMGIWPRVVFSLGQAYGEWVWRFVAWRPAFGAALERLRDHPIESARLAAAAGCSERTVALIQDQEAPRDPQFGEILRLADEAN